MKRSGLILAIYFFVGMILFPAHCLSNTQILQTVYKTFTIGTWQGTNILCEPYKVQKNDWIYKIFRKKGNLSEIDFPSFITIFKHLNPHISNLDNIQPGQQISIPLKKIAPRDFLSRPKDKVIVPILQMSELSKTNNTDRSSHQGPVKMDAPIHGSESFFLKTRNMKKIRRYAAGVQGRVFNKGTYYLPDPGNGKKDIVIELASTPIVQLENNSKIIILPHGFAQGELLKSLSLEGFWQNISFMDMNMVEKKLMKTPSIAIIPKEKSSALAMLVQKAKLVMLPYETNLRMHGDIEIPIKANLVQQDNQPDLLIFLGTIYGNALSILQQQGFVIISILPGDGVIKMGQKVFKALGITTILNPVFKNKTSRQSISIPGLFVGDGKNLFLSPRPMSLAVQHFFTKNRVDILQTNE